ncbi:MAG: acyl-CoA dehydrogenase family protein [Vulcanimicrobiaceae bacterium]
MDFTLSPEQLLIKDSVARFAASDHAGRDHWSTFAELGWLAIGAPEACGGFGGPLETLLLMEQFGRGLVVTPYAGQAVAVGTILRHAGRLDVLQRVVAGDERIALAYEEPRARYEAGKIAATATASRAGWTVRGSKVRVLGAASATHFLVSAATAGGIVLAVVPAVSAQVTRRPYAAEDHHDVADVTFDDAPAEATIGAAGSGLDLLERGHDHAVAALCAEAVGIMSVMLETTVAYTKQRRQFGVPIGSFQALQHRMAEMFVEVELARSMAYLAALRLDAPDDRVRRRGVSAAKAQIARSGRFVGQNAIQLHGGIGMSEEYSVGHAFKRLTTIERLFGDRAFHLARFAASAPARSETQATCGV